MREKTQSYPTRAEAFRQFTNASTLASSLCEMRNTDDPDLNESITVTTDEKNKRFTLTRPDRQDGIQVIHYVWTE